MKTERLIYKLLSKSNRRIWRSIYGIISLNSKYRKKCLKADMCNRENNSSNFAAYMRSSRGNNLFQAVQPFVSTHETIGFTPWNWSFARVKQKFPRLETRVSSVGNYSFRLLKPKFQTVETVAIPTEQDMLHRKNKATPSLLVKATSAITLLSQHAVTL